MAPHAATLAAGRPVARRPPARTRRRARWPIAVRLTAGPPQHGFAHVGKPGKLAGSAASRRLDRPEGCDRDPLRPRRPTQADGGGRAPPVLPTPPGTRDSRRGRSRPGGASQRPARRPRRTAPPPPSPRCPGGPPGSPGGSVPLEPRALAPAVWLGAPLICGPAVRDGTAVAPSPPTPPTAPCARSPARARWL